MSIDGAHRGIGAQRALETILGGKSDPTEKEEETRDQVRARLALAPTPEGPSPKSYGAAADALARAFLEVLKDAPGTPLIDDALWSEVKRRWPNFDQWVGGLSGFQVGWAVNCVRWLAEEPPVQNPALIVLKT